MMHLIFSFIIFIALNASLKGMEKYNFSNTDEFGDKEIKVVSEVKPPEGMEEIKIDIGKQPEGSNPEKNKLTMKDLEKLNSKKTATIADVKYKAFLQGAILGALATGVAFGSAWAITTGLTCD